jgi:hypothetical protein
MYRFLFVAFTLFSGLSFGQADTLPKNTRTQDLKLSNAVIVSHLDKQEDRFSLEIALSETLSKAGVKNTVSLNLLKQGGDPQVLITDSMSSLLKERGYNTLMLVSVRGYDKTFKPSSKNFNITEDLAAENLFPLYKEDIVSVTFEFHFYRGNELIYTDLIKIPGATSRDKVLKKLRKKLAKKIVKDWK